MKPVEKFNRALNSKSMTTWLMPILTGIIAIGLFFQSGSLYGQNCSVNAGIPQSICANQQLFLQGSFTEPIKSGVQVLWMQVTGPAANIVNSASLTSEVTNLIAGNSYTFRIYTTCADGALTYQDVTHTVKAISIATAGPDATYCPGASASLSANSPGINETGLWTGSSGGVTVNSTSSPVSTITITGGSSGPVTLRWTITNSMTGCSSYDELIITNRGGETVYAGADQTVTWCYSSTQSTNLSGSYGGSNIDGQQGTWSLVSGPNSPNIVSPHANNTSVTNLVQGTYVFRWTVTGPCTTGYDDVTIIVPDPTANVTGASISGGNQVFCDYSTTSAVLTGSTPVYINETVLWEQTSGPALAPGSIVNPTSPVTTINNLVSPNSYTFRYTINNAVTVCSSNASVSVSYLPDAPTLSIVSTDPILLTCGLNSAIITFDAGGTGTTQYRLISGPGSGYPTPWTTASSSGSGTGLTQMISGLTDVGTYRVQFSRYTTVGSATACGTVYDEISIVTSLSSVVANAGTDQNLDCNVITTDLVGNDPLALVQGVPGVGQGTWSQVSGPIVIILTDHHAPTLRITGLTSEGLYVFRWLISGGPSCNSSEDDVFVRTANLAPNSQSAGSNQTVCYNTPVYLNAAPVDHVFEVGTWTVSPTDNVAFSDTHSPTATVTNLLANKTYTFTWTIRNGCGSAATSMIVDVLNNVGPIVANAGADQCLASGTTTIHLAGNSPSPGTGLWTWVSGPAGYSIITPSSPTSDVSVITNGIYVFEWSVTSTGCNPTRDQVTITIDAAVTTASAGSDLMVCGNSGTLNAAGTAPTIGTGQWSQISGNGFVKFDGSLDTATWTNHKPVLTNLEAGVYVFRYTITNGACSSSDDVSVFVSEPPSPAIIALSSVSVCGSSTVNLAADAITSGTGIWTVVSGPNTPNIVTPGSATTTVNGLITGTYVFHWAVVGGPFCTAPNSDEITVTVTQNADAGADQSYCEAITSVNLTGTAASSGTWLQVGTTPNSATITRTGGNTAIASGLIPGVYTFEYSISSVGCSSTDQMTVTLYTPPSTAAAGADQNLCDAGGLGHFTMAATAPGAGTGVWSVLSRPDGDVGTFSNTALNSSTYTPTAGKYGVYVFQWTVSNASCSNSDQVRISNYAPPSAAVPGSNQINVCSTSVTMAATPAVVGLGTWSFESVTPTGGSTPFIASPTDPTTTISNLIPSAYPATYTFRWTVANGSPTCASNSATMTVTVKLPAVAANAGADQNLCNESTSFTLTANDVTPSTGGWSQVGITPNVATITTPGSATTTVTGITHGTYTFKWTSTSTTGCVSEDLVTVNNYTQPTADAGIDQSICQFSPMALNASSTGGTSWAWTVLTKPAGAPTPIFSNSSSPTTTVLGTTTGTYEFTWTVTNGTCTASDVVQVILNAIPSTATAGPDQSVCLPATTTSLAGNVPDAGSSGLWSFVSGPGPTPAITTPASPTSGVTGLTLAGTYTFKWTHSIASCETSDEMQIQVYALTTAADAGADQILCNASSFTLAGNQPLSAETGMWVTISGPNAPTITNANLYNTTVTGVTTGTYIFRWRITGGTCPTTTPVKETVTIVNNPVANAGSDQTTSATCGLTTLTLAGNNPAPSTGLWTIESGTGGSFGATPSTNATNYNATFTGVAGSTYSLKWTIAASGPALTACASATADLMTVTFNLSTYVNDPSDQTICSGSYTAPVFTGGTVTVYRWTNSNTSIGLAASGTGDLPTFTAANSGSANNVATITVTPEYDNSGVICYGTAQTFTITVKPGPTVISASTKTICSGSDVNYTPVSATSGTTFAWTASIFTSPAGGTITGISSPGSGTLITASLVNTGTSTGVVRYIITPTGPGAPACDGTPFNFDVTVQPAPNVTAVPDIQTICSGGTTSISLTTTVAGTTFYYAVQIPRNYADNIM